MEDVKDFLLSGRLVQGLEIALSGWIVDKNDGLYILANHYPEDYDHPYRLKIENANIIYSILRAVPSLGGGWSLLFYKARLLGVINANGEISVKNLSVQADRGREEMLSIDVSDQLIFSFVKQFGNYKFDRQRDPLQDWLGGI
jgi:hypothetical protein